MSEASTHIRKAASSEREALLDLINTAFSPFAGPRRDFQKELPFLFHDQRIGDHIVYEEDGELLGCVGLYPYDMRIGEVVFKTAGVGQVATLPKARGKGVMSALLNELNRISSELNLDFSWLNGDRRRYGRYGWATGGCRFIFETYGKYLPEAPDPETVRPFNTESDSELVNQVIRSDYASVLMPENEVALSLRRPNVGGWVMNNSFILHADRENTILMADGDVQELQLLLAHHAKLVKERDPNKWMIQVITDRHDSALMRACYKCYWNVMQRPSAMFRVVDLQSLLGKIARARKAFIGHMSGAVSLRNLDNDEAATLICEEGRVGVRAATESDETLAMHTHQLSEILFGICPLDSIIENLPHDSAIHRFLPFPLHIGGFFNL